MAEWKLTTSADADVMPAASRTSRSPGVFGILIKASIGRMFGYCARMVATCNKSPMLTSLALTAFWTASESIRTGWPSARLMAGISRRPKIGTSSGVGYSEALKASPPATTAAINAREPRDCCLTRFPTGCFGVAQANEFRRSDI
ncbi:hypothetical protein MVAC_05232 [Mycolicibacterium vaccae ATCC 25954]|uniref:Uncharacterized protein n=1 Tax=Mycolicibacterium vaccae ATCC 25954 TaxID=1194972 RepID=K0V2S5_MYCVA|nr:hypothetical protein MVAC_05232 [Mycolicibacterium vaccae ATCC 25954]